MELTQKVFWKNMQEMEMIEKMCSFTRQMMNITSLAHSWLISNQESLTAFKMVFILTFTILKISMSQSMVEALETTGLEVNYFALYIFPRLFIQINNSNFRLLRGRKMLRWNLRNVGPWGRWIWFLGRIYSNSLNSRRYWFRSWLLPIRKIEWQISKETYSNIFSLSQQRYRHRSISLQLLAFTQKIGIKCRCKCDYW